MLFVQRTPRGEFARKKLAVGNPARAGLKFVKYKRETQEMPERLFPVNNLRAPDITKMQIL
ncbi:MAG TPA: hypothetical protein VI757_00795 [Bacteroidia bacterium]|nr:hypothetical protein [Bacteroidia bacterium]